MKKICLVGLLSFNAGFIDAAGFIGLQGLFLAHVTGNLVTAAAALVLDSWGKLAKLIAIPEFICVLVAGRIAGNLLAAHGLPRSRIMIGVMVVFLFAFFVLAVLLGPFSNTDAPAALVTAFAAIAAMAIQNGAQRLHYAGLPMTTIMTGNVTQATLDAADLLGGVNGEQRTTVRARFRRMGSSIASFSAGCAAAAATYYWMGFWCLAAPVAVGVLIAILTEED